MECKTRLQPAQIAPAESIEKSEESKSTNEEDDERYTEMEHQMQLMDNLYCTNS